MDSLLTEADSEIANGTDGTIPDKIQFHETNDDSVQIFEQKTPNHHNTKSINNSIFNTISKLVNPSTKVKLKLKKTKTT